MKTIIKTGLYAVAAVAAFCVISDVIQKATANWTTPIVLRKYVFSPLASFGIALS